MGLAPHVVAQVCRSPLALPLASEHGGYIFLRLDSAGYACELHSLFKPEGWGREALLAGVEALGAVWLLGFQLITTLESAGNRRSRPPLSFGFRLAADFRSSPAGSARLWALSRADWDSSPARRRHTCPSP